MITEKRGLDKMSKRFAALQVVGKTILENDAQIKDKGIAVGSYPESSQMVQENYLDSRELVKQQYHSEAAEA